MKLISTAAQTGATHNEPSLALANDADPRTVNLTGIVRIDLNFPKFTDGRAFSQAFLLRRRLGFKGEIRATGDVLLDQLSQMQRSGFDAAVLRADQDASQAPRQLSHFAAFYQGDAMSASPRFTNLLETSVTGGAA